MDCLDPLGHLRTVGMLGAVHPGRSTPNGSDFGIRILGRGRYRAISSMPVNEASCRLFVMGLRGRTRLSCVHAGLLLTLE